VGDRGGLRPLRRLERAAPGPGHLLQRRAAPAAPAGLRRHRLARHRAPRAGPGPLPGGGHRVGRAGRRGAAGGAMRRLRELGLRTAIDDFGADHSSLGRLRGLAFDILKIDRSFLAEVPMDPKASAVVSAILALTSGIGMTAVAEGVETEPQHRFLVDEGCAYAQGSTSPGRCRRPTRRTCCSPRRAPPAKPAPASLNDEGRACGAPFKNRGEVLRRALADVPGRLQRVAQEHGDRHRADAARDGRDPAGDPRAPPRRRRRRRCRSAAG